MIVVNLEQGSAEWLAFRKTKMTASDAAAALGQSKYKTRNQLLREKTSGVQKEVGSFLQNLFDKGHEAEELARAILENESGEQFYPATAYSEEREWLSASFDGITIDNSTVFEHKLWNEDLAEYIQLNNDLPDTHWPQVEHQLAVSKAKKCVFVVSDGTTDNRVKLEYVSLPERQERVIEAWNSFLSDIVSITQTEVDGETIDLSRDYVLLKQSIDVQQKELKEIEEKLKEKAEKSGGYLEAGVVQVSKVERKGSIDYSVIPELKGVDVEKYRKQPSSYFRISITE